MKTLLKPLYKKSLCVLAATGILVGSAVASTPSFAFSSAGGDGYKKRGDRGGGGRRAGRDGKGYKKGYRQGKRDQRHRSKRSSSYYNYGYTYPSYGYGYNYPSYGYGYNYGYPSYSFGYSGQGNSGLGLGLGIAGAAAILSSSANKRARRKEEERERQYQRERAERDAQRDADYAYDQGRRAGEQRNSGSANNQSGDPEFGGNCEQKREYQTTIIIGDEEKAAYGTTCLRADGSWEMGKPKLAR
jgi:hypothetical protein